MAQMERERLERIRDELGDRPWHELGIEDLAGAAGLSRMTLHRRGIGKEEMREGLGNLLAEEFQAASLDALSSPAAAPERLRLGLEGVCRVNERYLGLIEGLGDDLQPIFHESGDGEVLTKEPFTDALRRILEDGEREGALDGGEDVEATATLLFNAAGWTYRHMRVGHRWEPERARSEVVGLLVSGVLSR